MEELAEHDNLIKAMGACFYTSKKMSDIVPCVFQALKEYTFEMRANKIRNLLSESKAKNKIIDEEAKTTMKMKGLGS